MMPLCGSGVSAVMRALQGLAVERGKVPGLVDGHNRQAGRHGIQLVARGMPVLRQLGIVIAKAKCHLQLPRIGRGGDVLAQRVLQLGNAGVGPIRRRQQVGRNRLQPHPTQVAVRIHKTGDQGAPLQVHHLRGGALPAGHLVTAPQRHDPARVHGHGFHLGLGVVHGQDGTTPIQQLRPSGWNGGTGRPQRAAPCEAQGPQAGGRRQGGGKLSAQHGHRVLPAMHLGGVNGWQSPGPQPSSLGRPQATGAPQIPARSSAALALLRWH